MGEHSHSIGSAKRARAALLIGVLATVACGNRETGVCDDDTSERTRPDSWTFETHCPQAPADYDEAFGDGVVRRLDFAIDPTVFADGVTNLESIIDSTTGATDLDALESPMWMPATLTYGEHQWTHVGLRWKGHASLVGAYKARIRKLSLKVSFDEQEDEYPDLEDQRFYGFKSFNLANGYKDDSLIRDKTAADIFRAAGVPAPRSSFAQVYVDIGDGPFYLGLYTIIEEPEDHMLEEQVGDDDGNLYKPWGDAARWPVVADTAVPGGATTVEDIQTHFEKANNEQSDWSDVLAAFAALHGDRSDAAAWRANLEAVFDVQAFLRALAVNQTIVNWDSYGCMNHNYLVYANPLNGGRFLWLPWDLNESLRTVEHAGCVPSSVLLEEIASATDTTVIDKDWPLIKLILADDTYRTDYREHLRAVLDEAFVADTVKAQLQANHDVVAPYLDGTLAAENGALEDALFPGLGLYQNATPEAFAASLSDPDLGLFAHVDARRAAVEAALASD